MRPRIGKTGCDDDLQARRPAVTPKTRPRAGCPGGRVQPRAGASRRAYDAASPPDIRPQQAPRGLPMSQSSQLVSLEAKAAPFLALRSESPAAQDSALPMQVIRRNGTVSKFDASKISVAMTKAFL